MPISAIRPIRHVYSYSVPASCKNQLISENFGAGLRVPVGFAQPTVDYILHFQVRYIYIYSTTIL
jgi:hypothetical protein